MSKRRDKQRRRTFLSQRPHFAIGERKVLIAINGRALRALVNRRMGVATLLSEPPSTTRTRNGVEYTTNSSMSHVLFSEGEGIKWVRGWDDATARAFEVMIALGGGT